MNRPPVLFLSLFGSCASSVEARKRLALEIFSSSSSPFDRRNKTTEHQKNVIVVIVVNVVNVVIVGVATSDVK